MTVKEQPAGRAPFCPASVVLALGAFSLTTTEFVTMGLLPEIAASMGTTIPRAGFVITAYAVGVVVGAPVVAVLSASVPRRLLAVSLLLAVAAGSALSAAASSFGFLLAARFLAALPHGAFFGVAAVIAVSLVPSELAGRAVGTVMLGGSVAAVAGVPAGAWMGQHLGWRSAYVAIAVLTVITAMLVTWSVPRLPRPGPRTSWWRELGALRRPEVQLATGVALVGFGGIFAMYTYVAKIVTDVTGLSQGAVPLVLFCFGIGAVSGTWLAGRLADWHLVRGVLVGFGVTAATLVAFTLTASFTVPVHLLVVCLGIGCSILAVTLQVHLMSVAGGSALLGAALGQSALNGANALGAWLGGVVIATGLGYRAPSLLGAGLAVLGGLFFLAGTATRDERVTVTQLSP